jgi:hypothetical protein
MTIEPDDGSGDGSATGCGDVPSHDSAPKPAGDADDSRGSVRWQDPSTTKPRPPTVAEARARDKAQKVREAEEQAAELLAEKARKRAATGKKVLIGSCAVVGVAAVIAGGYALFHSNNVTAACVKDGSDEVVPDTYCSSGYSGSNGVFIYSGSPYRYYYGGSNGGIGTRASGGTLTQPKGTTATTKSGSSISRGGFGSSSHGSSGS